LPNKSGGVSLGKWQPNTFILTELKTDCENRKLTRQSLVFFI